MGSRSALTVPRRRGNRPEGPRGGKRSTGATEPLEGKITGTPISDTVSTRLQRIAELAREAPERAFLSLAHHIDLEFLKEAFRRTRKDGATGVDGQTGKAYEEKLEENLQSLLDRLKSGRYQAPPVRRTYVPKGDGSQERPIGIPTFEDKVLQRAVTMVLEAVYEQDFCLAPTATDLAARRTQRWRISGRDSWRRRGAGSWSWTSRPFSTAWTTPVSDGFSTRGCAMECCVGRSTSGLPPASWRERN